MRVSLAGFLVPMVFLASVAHAQYQFTVNANNSGWTGTSVFVNQGQYLHITATGCVVFASNGRANPDGKDCVSGYPWQGYPPQNFLCPSQRETALVARIGQGPCFFVGSDSAFVAPASGELQFAFNDQYYSDNAYSFTVSVLVGSWYWTFDEKTDAATGDAPLSVALGDANEDQRLDIVTANSGANTVSVHLGNGDGTFQSRTDWSTGDSPQAVAVGDVNGDGHLDIVTADMNSSNVSILLGNGSGTFGARTSFGTGEGTVSVAVGDVNCDGHLDLATANYYGNTASVLLGDGAGGFGSRVDLLTGTYPLSVAVNDVNGDGLLDVVTANSGPNTVSIMLGTGGGGFGARTDFGTGSYPYSVAMADVNNDGAIDLVTANYHDGVSVLLGNGDGTFQAKHDLQTYGGPCSVAVGDLNGDGNPDVVAADYYPDAVSELLGNGDGTFAGRIDFRTGAGPCAAAIGDLNSDGRPDVVTGNYDSGTITILLNSAPLASAPALVAPLDVAHVASSPRFSWRGFAGCAAYDVVVSTDALQSSPVWVSRVVGGGVTLTYGGPPLGTGSGYYWSVRALTGGLWTPYSPGWRFFRDAGTSVPGTPMLSSPGDSAAISLPEIFSWIPVVGASSYRVKLGTDSSFTSLLWWTISSTPSVVIPQGITGLGSGATAYWSVSAVDAAGNEGTFGAPRSFTVGTSQQPPGGTSLVSPPDGATATASLVTFAWQPAPGATSYDFTYSLSPGFPASSNATWALSGLTKTTAVVGLPPAVQTIYWKVTPRNSAGTGPTSPVFSFAYQNQGVPVAYVDLFQPSVGVTIPRTALIAAQARIFGTFSGTVTGYWTVDGTSGGSFSKSMTPSRGTVVNSGPLPTGTTGTHSVQCVLISPASMVSAPVSYAVSDLYPGPAASIHISVSPANLYADGASQATISAMVLDSQGILVTGESGRAVTASVSGSGSVAPMFGQFSNGQWLTTYTAGHDPGQAQITIGSTGLSPAVLTVNLWPAPLAALKNGAMESLNDLAGLKVELPPYSGMIPVFPSYEVEAARSFVDNATIADTAALSRLTLSARYLKRVFHYDPAICPTACGGAGNPGALGLADDFVSNSIGAMLVSVAVVRTLSKIQQSLSAYQRVLFNGTLNSCIKLVLDYIDKTFTAVLNRDPSLTPQDQAAFREVKTYVFGYLNTQLDAGMGLLSLASSASVRHPLVAFLVGGHYVGMETQQTLARAVSHCSQPAGNTYEEAVTAGNVAYQDAAEAAWGADASSRAWKQAGDNLGLAAAATALIGAATGTTAVLGLTALAVQGASGLAYVKGGGDGLLGYMAVPAHAASGIDAIFGGASSISVTAPASALKGTEGSSPGSSTVGTWTRLLQTEATTQEGYEVVARQVSLAVGNDDTAEVLELLPDLIAVSDSLDLKSHLAESPMTAAAAEAWSTVAGFDSTMTSLWLELGNARYARLQLALAVSEYLAGSRDPVRKQQTIDACSAAITGNAAETEMLRSNVTALFTTAALPLIRMTAVDVPESVAVGVPFVVTSTWANLGAGNSTAGFAKMTPDSSFVFLGADSVATGFLDPGDGVAVQWTLVARRTNASDSLEAVNTYVQLMSGGEDALGETRTIPIRVHLGTVTGTNEQIHPPVHDDLVIAPNPGSRDVLISFRLDLGARTKIQVFDLLGRLVDVLWDGDLGAGLHTFYWDGRGSVSGETASGIFFVRVTRPGTTITRKLVLIDR